MLNLDIILEEELKQTAVDYAEEYNEELLFLEKQLKIDTLEEELLGVEKEYEALTKAHRNSYLKKLDLIEKLEKLKR